MSKQKHIILIAGSAGSIEKCIMLLKELKSPFNGTLVFVLHRAKNNQSELHKILSNATGKDVLEVEHGMKVESGIYIAPSDFHLLLGEDYRFYLDFSEKVNFSRPSIDVSFESFSSVLKESFIGILLSGASKDGTEGAEHIISRHGKIWVIDPETVVHSFMPNSAIERNREYIEVMELEKIGENIKEILL